MPGCWTRPLSCETLLDHVAPGRQRKCATTTPQAANKPPTGRPLAARCSGVASPLPPPPSQALHTGASRWGNISPRAMELLTRSRSSSIPRDYSTRLPDRFTVYNAAELLAKLLALDKFLHASSSAQEHLLRYDSILRPSSLEIRQYLEDFVHDTEPAKQLHDLIMGHQVRLRRPDGIAAAWEHAYRNVRQGREWVNETKFNLQVYKGRECTSSEAFAVLPQIDALLGTRLQASFDVLYANVKRFPFLQLPAELRIHIYSYCLPRAPYVSIYDDPTTSYKPPKPNLNLLSVSRQIHAEATKHSYENRILFLKLVRGPNLQPVSVLPLSRAYQTATRMSLDMRNYFKNLEIQIAYNATQPLPRQWGLHETEISLPRLLELFPHLESVLVSFPHPPVIMNSRLHETATRTAEWVAEHTPASIQLFWDFEGFEHWDAKKRIAKLMGGRRGIQLGHSVLKQCLPKKRSPDPAGGNI
ncbi:uncharacterized protein BDR25DRAFT_365519 [Lindgomyces ingoldianus]|uniref:Uncharacterized protein n=1 Tax=Lindgomyces ingoldianus TaxID=673940 RepID=A0ACB6RG54_9PLEO|nr:uncharacterized protein BDR25DRAFT_365519 [Lindgomyces ingoldianus]KAF2478339.1 hypothetical protein BDR25DRAFT_365519 [Lindgomyces ingoldianus]